MGTSPRMTGKVSCWCRAKTHYAMPRQYFRNLALRPCLKTETPLQFTTISSWSKYLSCDEHRNPNTGTNLISYQISTATKTSNHSRSHSRLAIQRSRSVDSVSIVATALEVGLARNAPRRTIINLTNNHVCQQQVPFVCELKNLNYQRSYSATTWRTWKISNTLRVCPRRTFVSVVWIVINLTSAFRSCPVANICIRRSNPRRESAVKKRRTSKKLSQCFSLFNLWYPSGKRRRRRRKSKCKSRFSSEAQFSPALAKFMCYYKAQAVNTVEGVCDWQIESSANSNPIFIILIT